MFQRIVVLLVFSCLLLPFASAVISSQRALDFVTNENYYLYKNESGFVFPTVKIKAAPDYYWLVAVGEPPVAYIPIVDKKDLAVTTSTATQRALFKAADVVWFVSKFKERLSDQSQWFFSTTNSSFFSNLSSVLQNEPFELESIKTDLKDSKANTEIFAMNASLVSMSQKAADIAEKINDSMAAEQAFLSEPDTNQINYFSSAFDETFSAVTDLDSEIIQYKASITKLKKIISESALDAGKKNQLLSFADAPQELSQVSTKASVANSVKQAVDSAFNSAITRSKDLIDNLALRIKRNTAGHALNDIDSDFKQKTENKFDSLAQAATVILSNDYSSLWKNQDALASFSDNYSQAKSFFDKGNFDMSINFSAKAKANAVTVLKDGFIEQRPTIDWTLWIYFAIGIVVLFAIIFALRNRGKLSALVQPQQEGEEIEIRGWERKN